MNGLFEHDPACDWVQLGESNPYFGVLSDDRYRGATLEGDVSREFFETGRQHVGLLMETLQRCFGDFGKGLALDFGCGVGRISQALAEEFEQVVGLDVSPGMLAEARSNAVSCNIRNLDYCESAGPQSIAIEAFDLVHSFIVLQHIPVAIGEPLIERLIAAVKPDGIGALHLTITPSEGGLAVGLRNLVKRNPILRILGNLATGRSWNSPVMEMNTYAPERIVEMLARERIEQFHCIRVDDWGSIGLFFLFRKDARNPRISLWSNPRTSWRGCRMTANG